MATPMPERAAAAPARTRSPPPRRSAWRRIRRIAVGAAIVSLLPVAVSLVHAVTQPSNSSASILAVEWLRDNGARGFVNRAESVYYSLSAPPAGGPGLRSLPPQPDATALRATPARRARRHFLPPPITPAIAPALSGEGVWHATVAHAGAHPPLLVTLFRADPAYPRLVVGVAWIDHTQTRTILYPGRKEPSGSPLARGPLEVPVKLRRHLLATFNSGFKLKDSGGGFALRGQTAAPLKPGIATLVRYGSGRIDVKGWNAGPDPGPGVVFARQNLPLIVNHARANPNLADGPQWGATLGNAVRVWRSGVGVDRHQNLIYAAANSQTVGSLAAILIRAGAVRAMELDINSYWVSFISYRNVGAAGAANLLASMSRPVSRYLTPDDRDFFAVFKH